MGARRADGRRTPHRRWIVGAVVSLVVGIVVPAAAAPVADAAIRSPIPMNALEEPTYDFVDDDALFVAVLSDTRGGTACIVAATVEDASEGSCDAPAWGSPNFIIGIGTTIRPLEAAPLREGQWKILTEDTAGEPTGLSEVFTVTPCDDCSRAIGEEAIARWKALAEQNRTGADLYCTVQQLKAAYAEAKDAMNGPKVEWNAPGIEGLGVSYSLGGGFAFSFPETNPFIYNQQKALAILKDLTCAVSTMYRDIVNDPPDPDYDTVPVPVIGTVAPLASPEATALAESLARQVGLSQASLVAFERYLGAVVDGEIEAVAAQATAAGELSFALAAELRQTAGQLEQFAIAAESDPFLSEPVAATQAELDELAGGYARVRESGFTAAELQQLRDLGLDDAQIEQFAVNFDRDPAAVTAGETVAQHARALAEVMTSTIVDLDLFAREATAVGARNLLDVAPDAAPTASFTATPSAGQPPLAVAFDGSGSTDAEGVIASYAWDFGDGSTGTGATAEHIYTAAGSFTATLTVTDGGGLSASATQSIVVTDGPNVPPVAVATATPAVGPAPLTFSLSAEGSSDADGTITAYVWSFPDGSTLSGPLVEATLPAAGTANVTLTVTDDAGDTASTSVSVRATAPPVARFTRTPGGGIPPLDVQFDASTSTDEVGITGYAWSFGDGTTATGPTARHTYATAGSYTVTLTVTDTDGQTAQATATVAVVSGNQPPVVDVGPDVTLPESNRWFYVSPQFSDPDGEVVSAEWDYGDGTTSDSLSVSHQYSTKGSFTATLTVTDDDGATASDSLTVTIINEDPIIYGFDVPARALPGVAQLMTASAYEPGGLDDVTGSWDFGDGSADVPVGATSQVSHVWEEPGRYTVTYTAADGDGGTSQRTAEILVQAATLDAGSDVQGFEGEPASFVRTLDGPQYNRAVVTWNFGDGTTPVAYSATYDQPIEHTYRDDGTYTVTVTMSFSEGEDPITDTTTATIANRTPSVTGIAASGSTVGEAVSFQVFATDVGLDDELTYSWTFGDGSTATGQAVEHTFGATGDYTVTVTARDDADSVTATRTVRVSAATPDDGVISNSGRDFWLAFNRNYSGDADLTLFITASVDTQGTVEVPGLGFSTPFETAAGSVTSVLLPREASLPDTTSEDQQVPLAVHVAADDDVSVYGLNYIPFTTDAFLALPVDALGTDYRTLSYPSSSAHEVSVVATENDTEVTVTPLVPLGSHPAGVPYTQLLDVGEVLMLPQANGDGTGTRVQSDRPVAVFSGMNCTNVPANYAYCDHLVEQLTPTSTWGRRFVTAPLASRQNGDTFRIVAATDDTEVRVDGELVATLDAGAVHEQILTAASFIESSEPVLVAQYANGSTFSGNPGDPFMMIVPPYEQFLNAYTVTTPASGFVANYVSVVAPGDGSGITLDGAPIPTSEFTAVGDSGYSAAAIAVEPGTHRLSSVRPFGLAIYGFNNDDSYGYTGGLSLSQVATVIEVDLTPATATAVVGATTCVTGTATDAADAAVVGVRMDFEVTGANPTSGFAVTDTAGRAEFCWAGAAAGEDTVTGTVSDVSDTATRTWRPPTVNQPPTATAQSVVTDEDVAVAVTLAGTDPEGATLSFAVASGPAHGTLSGSGGNLTYTPAAGYFGTDQFTFTVSDGELTSAPATVSITVNEVVPPNRAPTATAQSVATDEDVAVAVTLAGTDPDGDALSYAVASGPAHGALSGSGANLTYTPAAGYFGTDQFTFTVSDGDLTSAPATVSITVNEVVPPNQAPSATGQSVVTDEDVAAAVTLAGTDPEGATLSFAVASGPAHGTLSGSGADLTYTPAAGFFGTDQFTFTVSDGDLTSAPATVSITVNEVVPPNQVPTATPRSVITRQGVAVAVVLAGVDPDGDSLTYAVASGPAHGRLSGSGADLTYTPTAGYSGPDQFTFTVSDGDLTSAPATVSITVEAVVPPATTNRLLVSDDTARKVDVRPLDGETFRSGEPVYAFVGPLDKVSSIKRLTFWIDDPSGARRPFSVESDKAFDLARTASNGKAYPLESSLLSLGTHVVTAKVEYKTGAPVVLSATITIADAQPHRLQVSSRSDRTQATDLAGATLSGKRYVFLGTKGDAVLGVDEVVFYVDGKQVRKDDSVDYDLVGTGSKGTATAFDTTKLRDGTHQIVAKVLLDGDGVEIVYTATFTVDN